MMYEAGKLLLESQLLSGWYTDKFTSKVQNILERHEDISKRLRTHTPADILAEIKFDNIIEKGNPLTGNVPRIEDKENSPFPDIDLDLRDNILFPPLRQEPENVTANACSEDSQKQNCAWGDTVVTYSNPFDPRLSFQGLTLTGREPPRGNKDCSQQQLDSFNCVLDVQNPSAFTSAYLNNYTKYLAELRNKANVYKRHILTPDFSDVSGQTSGYHGQQNELPPFVGNNQSDIELWSRITATKRLWSAGKLDGIKIADCEAAEFSSMNSSVRSSVIFNELIPSDGSDKDANRPEAAQKAQKLNAHAQSFQMSDTKTADASFEESCSSFTRASSRLDSQPSVCSDYLLRSPSVQAASENEISGLEQEYPEFNSWLSQNSQTSTPSELGSFLNSRDSFGSSVVYPEEGQSQPEKQTLDESCTKPLDQGETTAGFQEAKLEKSKFRESTDLEGGDAKRIGSEFVQGSTCQATRVDTVDKLGTSFVEHTEQINPNQVFTMNVLGQSSQAGTHAQTSMFWSHQHRQAELQQQQHQRQAQQQRLIELQLQHQQAHQQRLGMPQQQQFYQQHICRQQQQQQQHQQQQREHFAQNQTLYNRFPEQAIIGTHNYNQVPIRHQSQHMNYTYSQQFNNLAARPVSQPNFGQGNQPRFVHPCREYLVTPNYVRPPPPCYADSVVGDYNAYGLAFEPSRGYELPPPHPPQPLRSAQPLFSLNVVHQQPPSQNLKFDDEVWYINGVPYQHAKHMAYPDTGPSDIPMNFQSMGISSGSSDGPYTLLPSNSDLRLPSTGCPTPQNDRSWCSNVNTNNSNTNNNNATYRLEMKSNQSVSSLSYDVSSSRFLESNSVSSESSNEFCESLGKLALFGGRSRERKNQRKSAKSRIKPRKTHFSLNAGTLVSNPGETRYSLEDGAQLNKPGKTHSHNAGALVGPQQVYTPFSDSTEILLPPGKDSSCSNHRRRTEQRQTGQHAKVKHIKVLRRRPVLKEKRRTPRKLKNNRGHGSTLIQIV